MSNLKQLQEDFQRGILAGDDTILSELKDSAKEDRRALFGVYRYAYVARLAEILSEDYAQLHAYLGDARFARLAKDYIGAHPSDRRSVRDFGRHFPDFLRRCAEFTSHPEISEIAEIEKALIDSFDGPDAKPLDFAALQQVAPEDWPRLVFAPHPTARRLALRTNAAELWSALHDERDPPKVERQSMPHVVLVWRDDATSRFRRFSMEEAMMWNEAADGTRFGVLCELVATFGGAENAELRAATYLRNWVGTGMLAGYRLC